MDPGPIFTIDTSSTVTCLLAANHYLPHHTFNPFLQQTGELDNLIVRWGKALSLCCAGLRVACNTCVTFPSSYWFDNLSFLLRENLLMCCFTPCSWGSQRRTPTSTQCCIILLVVCLLECLRTFVVLVLVCFLLLLKIFSARKSIFIP